MGLVGLMAVSAPPARPIFLPGVKNVCSWLAAVEILEELDAPETARQTGLSRSAVYDVLRGSKPRLEDVRVGQALARRFARERLERWRLEPPTDSVELLTSYLAERAARGEDVRRCAWDGKPIPGTRRSDARFCSDRCRSAARRQRAGR
jgi:hypothetical protein